jgi:hypothetical protein
LTFSFFGTKQTMGLREAREEAKHEWANMAGAATDRPTPSKGWTWGELVTAYRKYISEMREYAQGKPSRPPSSHRTLSPAST